MTTLRDSLEETLLDKSSDDFERLKKFLVPLQGNWFVPTIDKSSNIATWCGFIIMGTHPTQRATQRGAIVQKNVKTRFRLSFVGPQAEDFANQTLLWDERDDVKQSFTRNCAALLCYDDRSIYTKIFEQEGQNATLCWIVDMAAMSHYALDTHQIPWVPIGDGGIITTP
jgi:hypothetical protein